MATEGKTEKRSSTDAELLVFFEALAQKKAMNVVALDLGGASSIADVFLLASGRSTRQVIAVAEAMERFLKNRGRRPLGVEGKEDGRWVLLDYGDVLVHVFHEPVRSFYDLEGLWADACRVYPPAGLVPAEEPESFDSDELDDE
ncbi:MAG: ribosome silencing factor [Thermodesulfobacteriota bacterium]